MALFRQACAGERAFNEHFVVAVLNEHFVGK